jgi:hypothetical protein
MRGGLSMAALALAACGEVKGGDESDAMVNPDADPSAPDADPSAPDAGIDAPPGGCEPNTSTCASGMETRCNGDGQLEAPVACALGCTTDGVRCLDVAPSNGLGAALDDTRTRLPLTLTNGAIINTRDGTVVDGNGAVLTVASDPFTADGVAIRVFKVGSADLGNVTVQGDRPIAIVSNGPITIRGVVLLRGTGKVGGAGSRGCAFNAGHGGSSQTTNEDYHYPGGGGAGYATVGGNGGSVNVAGSIVGQGGAALATDVPKTRLLGGCSGGSVWELGLDESELYEYAKGGGGGGAIHLVSRASISITAQSGGATGAINAGGGGGGEEAPGGAAAGGAGGGSGGRIVLEAPTVTIVGAGAAVAANGGAGGGGCGVRGADATANNVAAAGGACPTGGVFGKGGNGSTGSPFTLSGSPGTNSAGGGGGAVGVIYIATSSGAATVGQGAFVSPTPTQAVLLTR